MQNGTFTVTTDMNEDSTGTNFTAAAVDVNGDSFGADEDGQLVAEAATNGGVPQVRTSPTPKRQQTK